MIIPVPGPTGGLVVVGESVIMYVRKKRSADDQAVKSIQVQATIVKVWPPSCINTAAAVKQCYSTARRLICNTAGQHEMGMQGLSQPAG